MTIIIDVSPEEEARFRTRAASLGMTLQDYVLMLVRRDLAQAAEHANGKDTNDR